MPASANDSSKENCKKAYENIESWKSIVHESSKKVFNLALDAIDKHPNVKGVIIEKKRIPRCDPKECDKNEVESSLSIY